MESAAESPDTGSNAAASAAKKKKNKKSNKKGRGNEAEALSNGAETPVEVEGDTQANGVDKEEHVTSSQGSHSQVGSESRPEEVRSASAASKPSETKDESTPSPTPKAPAASQGTKAKDVDPAREAELAAKRAAIKAKVDAEKARRKAEETKAEYEAAVARALKKKDDGNRLFSGKRLDEAIKCYSEALELAPADYAERSVFLSNRAQCYLSLHKYEKAVEDSTAALELAPSNVKALMRRGQALRALNRYDAALNDFRQSLEISPALEEAVAAIKQIAKDLDVPAQSDREEEERKTERSSGKGSKEAAEGSSASAAPSGSSTVDKHDTAKSSKSRPRTHGALGKGSGSSRGGGGAMAGPQYVMAAPGGYGGMPGMPMPMPVMYAPAPRGAASGSGSGAESGDGGGDSASETEGSETDGPSGVATATMPYPNMMPYYMMPTPGMYPGMPMQMPMGMPMSMPMQMGSTGGPGAPAVEYVPFETPRGSASVEDPKDASDSTGAGASGRSPSDGGPGPIPSRIPVPSSSYDIMQLVYAYVMRVQSELHFFEGNPGELSIERLLHLQRETYELNHVCHLLSNLAVSHNQMLVNLLLKVGSIQDAFYDPNHVHTEECGLGPEHGHPHSHAPAQSGSSAPDQQRKHKEKERAKDKDKDRKSVK